MKDKFDLIQELLVRFDDSVEELIIKTNNYRVPSFLIKLFYFFDVVWAFVLHGSSLNDYFLYEFYKKRNIERRKFITFRKRQRMLSKYLKSEAAIKLQDKYEIYKLYNDYLGRDWLYVNEANFAEFQTFIDKYPIFIAKPRFGLQGKGITIENSKNKDPRDLYQKLSSSDMVIEEIITQHPKMAQLHPASVNTVRITTILIDGSLEIMGAVLRTGHNGSFVDNRSAGGICAGINVDTGVVFTQGIELKSNRYTFHPSSNEKIVGFAIPLWQETLDLINLASKKMPEAWYVGWDIAITTNGPVLIEANSHAGMHIQQQPDQTGKYYSYRLALEKDKVI